MPARSLSTGDRMLALGYGLLCHVSFALGVGSMIVVMYTGMTVSIGQVPYPYAYATNALLLLQFPLAHSFLLSRRGRRWLTRPLPTSQARLLSTTLYATVASWQLLLLFVFWTPSGVVWWQADGTLLAVVTAIYAGTWALLGLSIFNSSWQLQSGALGWLAYWNGKRMPDYPEMPRFGLYRVLRQPIYLSFALTLWPVPTWTPDQLAVALTWTVYCLVAPRHKERRFSRQFREHFERYRARRPYMLPDVSAVPAALGISAPATRRDPDGTLDDAADTWWRDPPRWVRLQQALAETHRLRVVAGGDCEGAQVLVVGCKGGYLTEWFAEAGATVIGTDTSRALIEAAREHAESGSDGRGSITYHACMPTDLPVDDGSIDTLVVSDTLVHAADPERVVAECARVVKPGGTLYFDAINDTRLARFATPFLAEEIFALFPPGHHDPDRFVSPGRLRTAFDERGFTIVELKGLGPTGITPDGDLRLGDVPFRVWGYRGRARRSDSAA